MYEKLDDPNIRVTDDTSVKYTIQLESQSGEILRVKPHTVTLQKAGHAGGNMGVVLDHAIQDYNWHHHEKAFTGKVLGDHKGKTDCVLILRSFGDASAPD